MFTTLPKDSSYTQECLPILIIILRLHPLDNLLLLCLKIRPLAHIILHPRPHPLPRRQPHPLPLLRIPQPLHHRTLHRPQLHVILTPHEIQHPESVNMRLVRRRRNDAVDAALQEPIREERERVGDIHRDAAGVRFDVFPLFARGADLQCSDGLAEEERQAAEVGVAF